MITYTVSNDYDNISNINIYQHISNVDRTAFESDVRNMTSHCATAEAHKLPSSCARYGFISADVQHCGCSPARICIPWSVSKRFYCHRLRAFRNLFWDQPQRDKSGGLRCFAMEESILGAPERHSSCQKQISRALSHSSYMIHMGARSFKESKKI